MVKENDSELKIFVKSGGYVFHNGKLESVAFVRTEFRLAEWDDKYGPYYEAKNYVRLHSTGEVVTVDYDDVFDTPEDYEKGNVAETHYSDIEMIARHINRFHRSEITGIDPKDDAHSVVTLKFWKFVNGKPVECERKLTTFQFYYGNSQWSAIDKVFADGEETYMTRKSALSHNEYEVINSDGTKEKRIGTHKLLQLDDDQQKLIDELKDICYKIHHSDIMFVANWDENVFAINQRNVADTDFCYENPYYGGDKPEDWEEIKGPYEFAIYNLISVHSSDSTIWVKRNKTEKK